MKEYRWLFAWMTVVTLSLFSFLTYLTVKPLFNLALPPAVVKGKKVWHRYGCVECHTLLGNGGYRAPDLTHITRVRSRSQLISFFERPPVLHPGKKKRHLSLPAKDAQAVIAFLEYVNRINTRGWPPPPLPRRKG